MNFRHRIHERVTSLPVLRRHGSSYGQGVARCACIAHAGWVIQLPKLTSIQRVTACAELDEALNKLGSLHRLPGDSFRSPNFPLMARCLTWLLQRCAMPSNRQEERSAKNVQRCLPPSPQSASIDLWQPNRRLVPNFQGCQALKQLRGICWCLKHMQETAPFVGVDPAQRLPRRVLHGHMFAARTAHPSSHGAWGGVRASLGPLPPKEIQDRQTLGLGRQGRPSPAPPEKRQHRGWPCALHARCTSSCPRESRPPPQRPAPVCGRRLGRARARAAGRGPSASATSHHRHRHGAAGHVLPVSPGQAQLSSGCTLTRPAGG